MLLVLVVNFVSGFRLELMYISLILSIRSSLTLPHVKVKFRQTSNHWKKIIESAKRANKRAHHFQETELSALLANC